MGVPALLVLVLALVLGGVRVQGLITSNIGWCTRDPVPDTPEYRQLHSQCTKKNTLVIEKVDPVHGFVSHFHLHFVTDEPKLYWQPKGQLYVHVEILKHNLGDRHALVFQEYKGHFMQGDRPYYAVDALPHESSFAFRLRPNSTGMDVKLRRVFDQDCTTPGCRQLMEGEYNVTLSESPVVSLQWQPYVICDSMLSGTVTLALLGYGDGVDGNSGEHPVLNVTLEEKDFVVNGGEPVRFDATVFRVEVPLEYIGARPGPWGPYPTEPHVFEVTNITVIGGGPDTNRRPHYSKDVGLVLRWKGYIPGWGNPIFSPYDCYYVACDPSQVGWVYGEAHCAHLNLGKDVAVPQWFGSGAASGIFRFRYADWRLERLPSKLFKGNLQALELGMMHSLEEVDPQWFSGDDLPEIRTVTLHEAAMNVSELQYFFSSFTTLNIGQTTSFKVQVSHMPRVVGVMPPFDPFHPGMPYTVDRKFVIAELQLYDLPHFEGFGESRGPGGIFASLDFSLVRTNASSVVLYPGSTRITLAHNPRLNNVSFDEKSFPGSTAALCKELYITGNNLSSVPEMLTKLANGQQAAALRPHVLVMSQNRLTSIPSSLWLAQPIMEIAAFCHNDIRVLDPIPVPLQLAQRDGPPDIRQLMLASNPIDNLDWLRDSEGLKVLNNLDLASTLLTEIPARAFESVGATLEMLALSNIPTLERVHEDAFVGILNLRTLNLNNCPRLLHIPENLFQSVRSLKTLNIDRLGVDHFAPKLLKNMLSLTSFGAAHSNLRGLDPKFFYDTEDLRFLDLSGNKFARVEPTWFRGTTKAIPAEAKLYQNMVSLNNPHHPYYFPLCCRHYQWALLRFDDLIVDPWVSRQYRPGYELTSTIVDCDVGTGRTIKIWDLLRLSQEGHEYQEYCNQPSFPDGLAYDPTPSFLTPGTQVGELRIDMSWPPHMIQPALYLDFHHAQFVFDNASFAHLLVNMTVRARDAGGNPIMRQMTFRNGDLGEGLISVVTRPQNPVVYRRAVVDWTSETGTLLIGGMFWPISWSQELYGPLAVTMVLNGFRGPNAESKQVVAFIAQLYETFNSSLVHHSVTPVTLEFKCPPGISFPCPHCDIACTAAPGHYFDNAVTGTVQPCPMGSYTDATGAVGIKSCIRCKAGTYTGTPNRATQCLPCPTGTFAPEGQGECSQCPMGSVSSPGAAQCDVMPGYWSPNATGLLIYACPSGTYNPTRNQFGTEKAICLPCPNVAVSVAGSAACTTCSIGQRPNSGQTQCEACPAGTFSVALGICIPCTKGSVRGIDDPVGTCIPCAVANGQYAPQDGAVMCRTCPTGSTTNGISCRSEPGYYQVGSNGTATVLPCPAGTFSSLPGAKVCVACPRGLQSSGAASTCSPCNRGSVTNFEQTRCVPCPAGTYAPSSGLSECLPCGAGKFTGIRVGATSCEPCFDPESLVRFSPAALSFQCAECPKHSRPNENSTDCEAEPGYYRVAATASSTTITMFSSYSAFAWGCLPGR